MFGYDEYKKKNEEILSGNFQLKKALRLYGDCEISFENCE